MILKAVILSLVLVAVSGDSEVPPDELPDVTGDQVATVVWNYFSQQNTNAKEEEEQKSELTQQIKFARIINKPYTCDVKELVTFAVSLYHRLTKDSDKLKEENRKELEELRARMLPHAQNVSQSITDSVRALQGYLFVYPIMIKDIVQRQRWLMRVQTVASTNPKERLFLKYLDNLQSLVTSVIDKIQKQNRKDTGILEVMQITYIMELREKLNRSVDELRLSLAPFAQDVQDKLDHQLEGLSFQMRKRADQLQANISAGYQELWPRLKVLIEDTRETLSGDMEDSPKALDELHERLDQQLEEFQHTLALYVEPFGNGMVQLVKQFGQKLGPNPGDGEDYLIFLEMDLKDKVRSFFNRIQKETHDKRLALQNQDKNLALLEQAGSPAP
ncbi:apolipoprotein A-IV-like isoform X2 [Sorex fumeus]|uniref:apolipoprotein A-IV-like isoform X2 n=1 Tax=Sorex fumeus TaxID=62283 RepID=UPI0024ADE8B3|nr:apolipoprotein A-IV-like isoform X2 [Sorex fumeus]